MAVTFTSHGYDTTTANPYTEIAWADAHPRIGSSLYGVRFAEDWAVSAVSGADRTVSIAPGFGWGCGVTDVTTENETIQLAPIASGSRWDLIVVRRDWTPTAGTSKFVAIQGGAAQVIPGGRLSNPGGIDDQPIALVQVTAGQTQPTAITDVRCWAINGGVVAKSGIVKGYLGQIGTRLYIAGVEYIRALGANDVPTWDSSDVVSLQPLPASGYSITGAVTVEPAGTKRRVTVDIDVKRTGSTGTIPSGSYASFGAIIPSTARGDSGNIKYLPVALAGGANNIHATISLDTASGVVGMRAIESFSITPGSRFTVNATYYI